jgi:hypothetical protein
MKDVVAGGNYAAVVPELEVTLNRMLERFCSWHSSACNEDCLHYISVEWVAVNG